MGLGLSDGSSAANAGGSALQIKQRTGTTTNGLYWIKPPNGPAEQVWCDMNTAGGGWILIARTHPSFSPTMGTFGWNSSTLIGGATTFGAGYHLGLKRLTDAGFLFNSFIYGNQRDIVSNEWGPFVYQVGIYTPISFMGNIDPPERLNERSTVKMDLNVYGSSAFPPMQQYMSPRETTTTNENLFNMRDVTPSSGYGISPVGMLTGYCNSAGVPWYAGAFCNGATLSGNDWVQGGSSLVTNMGGTSQVMLMVR
jgi:hypothetical protein